MNKPEQVPYGTWKSPITSDLIVSETIGLGQVQPLGDTLYWVEMRPQESGRYVVVKYQENGTVQDVTPIDFNVRTRVHEYGGVSYLVTQNGIFFSNFNDQQLYFQAHDQAPEAITSDKDMRYADYCFDEKNQRLLCVREDHSGPGNEPKNTIVSIDLKSKKAQIITEGSDFYAYPRINKEGTQVCWIQWNHPNMPWDGSELWVANFGKDASDPKCISGGESESIFQPEWENNGNLTFVSDKNGWWNLYRWNHQSIECLHERKAEFGQPLWQFGMSTYSYIDADRIVTVFREKGFWHLGIVDTKTKNLTQLETTLHDVQSPTVWKNSLIFLAGSTWQPLSIIKMNLGTKRHEVIKSSSKSEVDTAYLSKPELVEFPTTGNRTAFGYFYPPKNRDFTAPKGQTPPLIVRSHGGPTSAARSVLNWEIQYWTSRGIAVVDVDYGGSTGYGREYRQRLQGNWGIVDVDDCANAVSFLANKERIDPKRVAIRGGSAGGYTTLCGLTFKDTFRAGASYFGVSDLEALAKDTHKFESRYLDKLIGPYPERKDLYIQRSPIHSADQLSCPIIFFQGLEDKVVPPNQAEMMVDILKEKGIPVAYVSFPKEQHGFRQAKNIKRSLDSELYFYSKVLGFDLPGEVAPVEILNL